MVTATSNDSSPLVSYARDEMQRAEDHGATWYDLAGNKGVRA